MIIFRYLAKEVLITMTAVTAVLLLIIMSGRFVSYLSIAAAGEISMEVVFYYLLFRLPGFLELILPLGLFLGILLAYGRLYLESEMVVLQATGMSQRRLAAYTLGPAFMTSVFVAALTIVISPYGANKIEGMLLEQKSKSDFELITAGRFQTTTRGDRVTYVEKLKDDGSGMTGVFITEKFVRDGKETVALVVAEQGRQYTNDETGARYLVLDNGYRYEGNPGHADYREIAFEEYGIRLPPKPSIDQVNELYSIPTKDLVNGDAAMKAQLHWRFSLPLLTIVVALMAVPLSKTNPRQGRYAKLIPSILLYMAYLLLLTNVRNYLEKGNGHVAMLWGIHFLFIVVALNMLFAKTAWQRMIGRREAQNAA